MGLQLLDLLKVLGVLGEVHQEAIQVARLYETLVVYVDQVEEEQGLFILVWV